MWVHNLIVILIDLGKRLRVLLKKSINNTLLCRPFTHTHMDIKLSLFWRSTDIRGANTDVKHRLFTMN